MGYRIMWGILIYILINLITNTLQENHGKRLINVTFIGHSLDKQSDK